MLEKATINTEELEEELFLIRKGQGFENYLYLIRLNWLGTMCSGN